jgi:hypothetical protein
MERTQSIHDLAAFKQNGSLMDEKMDVTMFCTFCGVPTDGEYCPPCLEDKGTGPLCACGVPTKKWLCHKKDSIIYGQYFFSCVKEMDDPTRCAFYEVEGGPKWTPPPVSEDKCKCGERCVVRVVRKEGKQNNIGRRFHSCAKPPGQGCDFFKWVTVRPTKQDKLRAARLEYAKQKTS